MTIIVANTELTQTFDNWRTRTNELAFAMSGSAVTIDSNNAVGNAEITGSLGATTVYVGAGGLAGGTIASPSYVTFVSNTVIAATLSTFSANTKFDGANNFLGLAANVQISGANATHSYVRANNSTDKLFWGINSQAANTVLDDIVALSVTNNNIMVANGTEWVVLAPSATRTALDLVVGTNVQAWDAQLDDLALLAATKGRLAVANGTNWIAFPVGSNNQIISANTEVASGINWKTESVVVGKQTAVIDAVSWVPEDGAAGPEIVTVAGANNDYKELLFDGAATETAFFKFRSPKSSDESGTLDFTVAYTPKGTSSGNVIFQMSGLAVGAGDLIDGAFGTAVVVETLPGATANVKKLSGSMNITPGGTWAEGDTVYLKLQRVGGHANDSNTDDIGVQEVEMIYTTTAATDD